MARELRPAQIVETRAVSLVEVLDRVLDKGLVVAGDIRVWVANVELLTIQIRLLVCSIDKAEQIGMNWWRNDKFLASDAVERRLARIERRLEALAPRSSATARRGAGRRTNARKS